MSKLSSAWRLSGVVAATALVTAVATIALANHQPWHKVYKGKAANKTVVVTGEEETNIFSNDWVDIRGAKTAITVPQGERALIIARFTAETVCHDGGPDECSARLLIGGTQAKPASGRDFHIDTHYAGETFESEKGHAFDRSLMVGPGRHNVKVQATVMGSSAIKIDDWSLTVERVAK